MHIKDLSKKNWNKQTINDLWSNIKETKIHVTDVPERGANTYNNLRPGSKIIPNLIKVQFHITIMD
jgi:hypothetical protein